MSVRSRHLNDILALPTGALADASLAIARSSVSRPIVDHSIRSFLFARLLADHEGCLDDAYASRSDAAAPPGSLAFELLRQHREAEHARVRRQESPERRQPSWPTKQ